MADRHEIDEAQEALRELARALGRMTAEAAAKLNIEFDIDNPEVAKDLILEALYAVVPSLRPPRSTADARPQLLDYITNSKSTVEHAES